MRMSDGEATAARIAWEREEQYKAEVKVYEQELERWQRNASFRQRQIEHEQIIRRQHVMIYGLPIALPPYRGGLSAPEVTAATHKAFEEFQESTPDLKPSERSCVIAILENQPAADVTDVKVWKMTLDALRDFLVVETEPAPIPPTPPAVKDKAVVREQELVDDSKSTLEHQRGSEFRQLFVNIVAEGTEWTELQMINLFNRYCKTHQVLSEGKLRAFLISLYSPDYVDSPTAAEIQAYNDEREDRNLSADELRRKYNQRGWR